MQLERVANWLGLNSSLATTPFERSAALSLACRWPSPGLRPSPPNTWPSSTAPREADSSLAERAWRGIRLQVWHDAIRAYLLELLEEDPPAPAEPTEAAPPLPWV